MNTNLKRTARREKYRRRLNCVICSENGKLRSFLHLYYSGTHTVLTKLYRHTNCNVNLRLYIF